MFKVGDSVIYNKDFFYNKNFELKENVVYTIIESRLTTCRVEIKNDIYDVTVLNSLYNVQLFISLLEYRKQKIKKICSRLEIK